MRIFEPLFSNKSKDEKNSIKASIFSISLFEISITFEIIRSKKLLLSYILLSITMLIFPLIFFILVKLYEFILLKNPDFILYPVKKGDSLKLISKEFFPECNYKKVCKIILAKNKLLELPNIGDLILIPIKKEKPLKHFSFINILFKKLCNIFFKFAAIFIS